MNVLHPNIKVAYKVVRITDLRNIGRDILEITCEDEAGLMLTTEMNRMDLVNFSALAEVYKRPNINFDRVGWLVVNNQDKKYLLEKYETVYVDAAPIEKNKLKADIIELRDKLAKEAVESIQKENKGPKDYDKQEQYIKTVIELRKTLEL